MNLNHLKESDYLKKLKSFLDAKQIAYQKIAPSPYTKSGLPDLLGTFKNGKIFRIELKRFNKKTYAATLLQKYQMLKAAQNQELVFYINNEAKFQSFCEYVNLEKYLD